MSDPHRELESTPAPPAGLAPGHTHCANCGTPLYGSYCYQCGQSTKHMLKHLPALAADAADAILNIDGRIMHTLPALYLKPGFLANEYFAGRRTRYIPPFRLMFFMSVLAFLLIHLTLIVNQSLIHFGVDGGTTPAEVHDNMQRGLTRIDAARRKPGMSALGQAALGMAAHALPVRANRRLKQFHAAPLPAASVPAPPSTAAIAKDLRAIAHAPSKAAVNARAKAFSTAIVNSMDQVGESSDIATAWLAHLDGAVDKAKQRGLARLHDATGDRAAKTEPPTAAVAVPDIDAILADRDRPGHETHLPRVDAQWLPAFVRNSFNAGLQHAETNLNTLRSGSDQSRRQAARHVAGNILSVTPQTLFVLIPLLAILLKLMYVFKSRLYIEHLIVTLYSHAFIFSTLFLSALLALITGWLPGWAGTPSHWLQAALWIWLPVYLLLMQKRVYRQGWFLTVAKYCFTGVCYSILLTFALAIATLIGLAS